MTTFPYNGQTYTAVYVDPSSLTNGTGESTSDPLNIIPDLSSITANTAVIIRRTSTVVSKSSAETNTNINVMYIGSPTITDPLYPIIPGASVWSNDVDNYVQITFNSSDASGLNFNGTNTYVSRLKVFYNYNNTTFTGGIISVLDGSTINNCYIGITGADYDLQTDLGMGYYLKIGIYVGGNHISISNVFISLYAGFGIKTKGGFDCNWLALSNVTIRNYSAQYCSTNGTCFDATTSNWLGNLQMNSCDFKSKINYTNYGTNCFVSNNIANGVINKCSFENLFGNSNYTNFSCGYQSSLVLNDCNFTINYHPSFNIVSQIACDIGGKCTFRNCVFTSGNNPTNIKTYALTTSNSYYTNHTHINTVFDMDGITFPDSNSSPMGLLISNCSFLKGTLCLNSPLYVNTIRASEGLTLYAAGNSIYHTDNLLVSHLSSPLLLKAYDNAKVFITNTDADLINGNILDFGGFDTSCIYVANNNGIQGNWAALGLKHRITTTNAYRTGGANYGLKYQTTSQIYSSATNIWIAPQPYDGIPVNFGTSGNKKVSIYFAYKLFTDPDSPVTEKDIYVEVETPNGVVTNSSNGQLVDDTSVWNNDSGLVTKRFDINFSLAAPGTCYVRMAIFKWQGNNGGYILIDPTPIGVSLP